MASPSSSKTPPLRAFVQGLQPRERLAVGLAVAVLGLYLLWAVALAWWLTRSAVWPITHRWTHWRICWVMCWVVQARMMMAASVVFWAP